MEPITPRSFTCPVCGGTARQCPGKDRRNNTFSLFDRIRNLFSLRAHCPSCAIVFRISRLAPRTRGFLPSPYSHSFFVYPSSRPGHSPRDGPSKMRPDDASSDIRPAVFTPRPARIFQPTEAPKPPFQLGVHSTFLGINLDLSLDGGTLFKGIADSAASVVREVSQITKESLLPALKTWINDADIRRLNPPRDVVEEEVAPVDAEESASELLQEDQEDTDQVIH